MAKPLRKIKKMTLLERMKQVRNDWNKSKNNINHIANIVTQNVGDFLLSNNLGAFILEKEFVTEYSILVKSRACDDSAFEVVTVRDFKVALSDVQSEYFECDIVETHKEVTFLVRGRGFVSAEFHGVKGFEFDSYAKFVGTSYSDLQLVDYKGNLLRNFTALDIEKAILVEAFPDAQSLDDLAQITGAVIPKENMQ
jgi:hypothetical protein